MTNYTKGQLFHDIFSPGDVLNDPFPGKTLEEVVLKTAGGSNNLPAAGMHAVAGILNATHDFLSASYPFAVGDVIADFKDAYIKYKAAGDKPGKLRRFFLKKYNIYKQEGVACPLPLGVCKPPKLKE